MSKKWKEKEKKMIIVRMITNDRMDFHVKFNILLRER